MDSGQKSFSWPKFLLIVLISVTAYFLPLGLSADAMIVLSVLVLAALLWVTETIPLFLTSLVVSILLVVFGVFSFNEALEKFADPVLVLFFGGFLIAQAMQETELDKRMALTIARRVKNDKQALLALMFVTAFLSLWISNTAATVVMIPIALGIVKKFEKTMSNFNKAAVLGIAYASNIGGVGTILGSPPNAITVSALQEHSGIVVSFFDWAIKAMPLVIILVPIAWFLLLKMFPFKSQKTSEPEKPKKLSAKQTLFLFVFAATVLLWLTESIHGYSSSLVAVMGAAALFLIGLLKPADLNKINYQVLILFGGGLVLGAAMFSSGLSAFFADNMAGLLSGQPDIIVIVGLIVFSIALGALASNTATAAILVPVMIPLSGILGFSPETLAMLCGIAVSFDFLLPVGTPPNAIAYSTGYVTIREMLKTGIIMTAISIAVLAIFAGFVWT